jgi:hypothetical protein
MLAPRSRPVPISDLVPDTDLMDSRFDDVDIYAPRHDFWVGPLQYKFHVLILINDAFKETSCSEVHLTTFQLVFLMFLRSLDGQRFFQTGH